MIQWDHYTPWCGLTLGEFWAESGLFWSQVLRGTKTRKKNDNYSLVWQRIQGEIQCESINSPVVLRCWVWSVGMRMVTGWVTGK